MASALGLALLLGGADGIEAPLGGRVGDPVRGRAIVVAREVSACLLCHAGPFPEMRFQGDVGPSLEGVGARLSPAQIRLRLVDPAAANPETVMPSFHTITGLNRVGRQWQGRPVLNDQGIEDVVAFLATLR